MNTVRDAQRAYIRKAASAKDTDPTNLARAAGLAPSTLNRFLTKEVKHILSAKTLSAISVASGIPVPPEAIGSIGDEVRTINPDDIPGVRRGIDGVGVTEKLKNLNAEPTGRIAEIDVRAGMGGGGDALVDYRSDDNGEMVAVDAVAAEWELPSEYLSHELRVRPGLARIIEVQGDSMEPTLFTGDRVMIDLRDRAPSPPGVFALWDGIGVVVKRVEHIPNSDPAAVVISSDNPKHGRYERTVDEVKIIGRVVWFGRRM